MIGIPIKYRETIYLFDNKDLESFISSANSHSDKLIQYDQMTRSLGTDSYSDSITFGMDDYEPVRYVGNYKISIVFDIDAFNTKIDWSHFTKPHDFETRVSVFRDVVLFPRTINWAYVIAQAITPLKEDGFSVAYSRISHIYLPTCHEMLSKETHETKKDYDVTINVFSRSKSLKFPFKMQYNVQYSQDGNFITSQSSNYLKTFSGSTELLWHDNYFKKLSGIPCVNYASGSMCKSSALYKDCTLTTTKLLCSADNYKLVC